MAYGPARFCVALALLGLVPGLAQAPRPQRIDKLAAGVRFDLPGNWTLDNRPFRGPGDAAGLIRAGSVNGRTAVQVYQFESTDADDFDAWIADFEAALRTIPGVVAVQQASPPPLPRPARMLLVRAEVAPDQIDTSYVCLRLDAETVLTFAHSTASVSAEAGAPLAADRALQVLLGTLQVYHDPELARELPFARRRGLKFLRETLPAAIRGVRLDPDTRHYLLEVAGNGRGYRTITFRPERHSAEDPSYGNTRGEPGLRVHEEEWQFAGPHASFSSWDAFSSVSGKTGLYEVTLSETAQIGGVFTAPLVTRDECIRAGDQLVTSYTHSLQVALPDPRRPFTLGRDFLGLGWVRVLPALLPTTQTEWLTVMSYHPESRDLVPFTIRCVGEIDLEGQTRPGRRFEFRWGHGPVVTLTADAFGNPLHWTEGDHRYRLGTAEDIEQRYAEKREAARPRLSNVPTEEGS